MNRYRLLSPILRTGLVVTALLLCAATPARAALGEVIPLRKLRATAIAGRTLHVRENEGVREYATADGKVFAVAWQRALPPDLDVLLGSYMPAYRVAVREHRLISRTVSILRTPELVVSKFFDGHTASGMAYVPAHLPKGVTPDALR